jgi:maltose alpha-D-glucosyltransferase / alpha-amylase
MARTLGVRTAEMHIALTAADNPDLQPRPGSTRRHRGPGRDRIRQEPARRARCSRPTGAPTASSPPPRSGGSAEERLDRLREVEATRQKIRVHGDYHLGQTLYADGEFYILDFEGEPARPLEARRQHDYALRDVAGMLRSLSYAALRPARRARGRGEELERWAEALVHACEATFTDAYLHTAEDADFLLPRGVRRPFLWAYLLDKALYEVRYELNNRPEWTRLPLHSLRRLLREAETAEPASR